MKYDKNKPRNWFNERITKTLKENMRPDEWRE